MKPSVILGCVFIVCLTILGMYYLSLKFEYSNQTTKPDTDSLHMLLKEKIQQEEAIQELIISKLNKIEKPNIVQATNEIENKYETVFSGIDTASAFELDRFFSEQFSPMVQSSGL